VPDAGTPEFKRWRANVVAGKRKSKARRRSAGLMSIQEVALQFGLPVSFVRRKADRGEVRTIESGPRRYIWITDAARVFGQGEGTAA
jgi:hypothetical protein